MAKLAKLQPFVSLLMLPLIGMPDQLKKYLKAVLKNWLFLIVGSFRGLEDFMKQMKEENTFQARKISQY